jgi:hypothetical protein
MSWNIAQSSHWNKSILAAVSFGTINPGWAVEQ